MCNTRKRVKAANSLRSLARHVWGTVAVSVAICVPILLGMGALTLDFGRLITVNTELQSAAAKDAVTNLQTFARGGANVTVSTVGCADPPVAPCIRFLKSLPASDDDPITALNLATSLNNLAALYDDQGRYSEAEPYYKRALAIWEKALGPEHPQVAQTLNNLAALYYTKGQYVEAEPLFKRALALVEKALGPDHPHVATSVNNLAELYQAQGKYAEAEPLLQRSLAIREKALGPQHPHVATTLQDYAP